MNHEAATRLISFALIFVLVALWEIRMPRRPLKTSKKGRWLTNLSIIAINPVLLQLVFPVLPLGMAHTSQVNGWGLINQIDISSPVAFLVGIITLDLIIYLQHVMFHSVPALWRLHMMHHADLDYDLTTGLRFHPIEVMLSIVLKLTVIVALGPPVVAVLVFEVILNGMAMFNHGNIKIQSSVDRFMRLFVVTPDMHRVHHSVINRETNSNYGFNLSIWDKLFGTYLAQPSMGHEDMVIGLSQFRDQRRLTLPWLLILPLIGKVRRKPTNK